MSIFGSSTGGENCLEFCHSLITTLFVVVCNWDKFKGYFFDADVLKASGCVLDKNTTGCTRVVNP